MKAKMSVMILGDASVGKTSLVRNIDEKPHEARHLKTIALDYITTTYKHEDGQQVEVKVWDTAGQDKFKSITPNFYRSADGMIIAFDQTN